MAAVVDGRTEAVHLPTGLDSVLWFVCLFVCGLFVCLFAYLLLLIFSVNQFGWGFVCLFVLFYFVCLVLFCFVLFLFCLGLVRLLLVLVCLGLNWVWVWFGLLCFAFFSGLFCFPYCQSYQRYQCFRKWKCPIVGNILISLQFYSMKYGKIDRPIVLRFTTTQKPCSSST